MVKRATRTAADPLAAVTPAYRGVFSRLATVTERVKEQINVPGAILDQQDVEELEFVFRRCLEIESQMRRWMRAANDSAGR